MPDLPKKLGNNDGVKLSSTLGGQRELIRQHRNKINEIITYLQAKEEDSKYKVVSFDPVGETVPASKERVTIKNNRRFVEVETEPSKLYWSGVEASKGGDKVDKYGCCTYCHKLEEDCTCGQCRPPEHDGWEEFNDKFINIAHPFIGSLQQFKGRPQDVKDYIQANFVSKEKMRGAVSTAYWMGSTHGKQNRSNDKYLNDFLSTLGLDL